MKSLCVENLNKKIIVFGTGYNCWQFMKRNSLPIAYFVDNDKDKQNKKYNERLVKNPDFLKQENINDILIVVATAYYDEIREQLESMGFVEKEHFVESECFMNGLVDNYYEEIVPAATYAPWKEDETFLNTYNTIKSNTLVDKYRCFELWSLVEQVSKLDGALIEIGVWRGGTGALIAKKAQICGIKDTIYLCDTFEGVVKAGEEDNYYMGGEHSDTNVEIVTELLRTASLENANILKGIFPDETASLINEKKFRFCHIDVDVFESAKEIFTWVWEKLAVGGVVVYDDYGFSSCSGVTKHVNELKYRDDLIYIHNLNGHAILIKIK